MGVCTEERPVMHWHQSARFLGPPRERSPDLTNACQLSSNNNNINHRTCISCTDTCEHSLKATQGGPGGPNAAGGLLGVNHIYTDSCHSFESVPDRLIADRPNYFADLNRSDCSDSSSVLNSCIQLKSEPPGGPSSPESSNELPPTGLDECAGCDMPIQDRFYLSAVERKWHASCLQCCICRQTLEGANSCFSRDGNIYCKTDYYRVFGSRRCSKCLASISSSELVMRARHLVFHIRCFSCAVCATPLTKGDHFTIRDSAVFCRSHIELPLEAAPPLAVGMPMQCPYQGPYGSSPNAPLSPECDSGPGGPGKLNPATYYPPHGVTGLPQQPRQKGRPRKRKPKDIEAMTASLDLNTEYLDLGFSRGLGSSSRAKRMRTSFKHHQLRTMKSYFAINHNPDAKDLKQLSQKTGLPKRVLQVWFQNARAKWRRMMMKQEGKIIDSDKGDGSLDLDGYVSHSPGSYIMGGPGSPSSLD
ncbi:protein apterous-like [Anopheles bellator]|uniref:protein apterous-like n=2 Tax=Kerteszia TaxID=68877 RepID=UPI0026491E54|nr:protein apterous-like [Anopheles bellator]